MATEHSTETVITIWETMKKDEKDLCSLLTNQEPYFGIDKDAFKDTYAHKLNDGWEKILASLITKNVIIQGTLSELSIQVISDAKNPGRRISPQIAKEAFDNIRRRGDDQRKLRYKLNPELYTLIRSNKQTQHTP